MFDRLIESDTTGANFRPRRQYFVISSVVVGILFVSAVIFSIYAAEIGLGNDEWEHSSIVAPPPPDPAPEPPKPQPQNADEQRRTELPQRQENMPRPEENPTEIPPISVVPNIQAVRPTGLFELGPQNTDPPPMAGPQGSGTGSGDVPTAVVRDNSTPTTDDQPKREPPPLKPPPPKYIGVANGYAIALPKPSYPPTALLMGIQGKVDVQITIDEEGRVISAKAASGHPFLRGPAESAAWKARFKPTTISNIPVKVTGVIVYNFTRN